MCNYKVNPHIVPLLPRSLKREEDSFKTRAQTRTANNNTIDTD